jgi:hypothetical protein
MQGLEQLACQELEEPLCTGLGHRLALARRAADPIRHRCLCHRCPQQQAGYSKASSLWFVACSVCCCMTFLTADEMHLYHASCTTASCSLVEDSLIVHWKLDILWHAFDM